MKKQIPEQNRKYIQRNDSEALVDSNLLRTWNIDLTTSPGDLMVSPRLYKGYSSTDDADCGLPVAFTYYDNNSVKYWAVCGSAVFKCTDDSPTSAWQQDATASSPTCNALYSDIVSWKNDLLVSLETNIAKLNATWDATWWTGTKAQAALTSGRPSILETVNLGSPLLCIGDANKLHTMTEAGTITNSRLTLQTDQIIRWIKGGTQKVYIGTTDQNWQKCYVYEWDGGDTVPTRAYAMGPLGALAGYVLNDQLFVVTIDGKLKTLQGSGLVEVNRWPISKEQSVIDASMFTSSLRNFIHPRGISAYKGKLLFNISMQRDVGTTAYSSQNKNNPSGIWEYDPETNSLSHKYSLTLATDASKDFGQMATPSHKATGYTPGAMYITTSKWHNTPMFVGGSVFSDDATTLVTSIYFLDQNRTLATRGSVIYPKVYTSDMLDTLDEIVVFFKKMKSASDKLFVKYRVKEDANLPFEAAVVWTDGNTITSTNTGFANAVAGNEVEVIMGNGSGTTCHISSISYSNPTYTIELDETVTGVSAANEGLVRVDNWKKVELFNDQANTYRRLKVNADASAWSQVKIELRSDSGESPVIERVFITTKPHTI